MPRVNPKIVCHKFDIYRNANIVGQNPRKMVPDQRLKVYNKVGKLLTVKFIKSVECPKWVSNIIVVPKKRKNHSMYRVH